MRNTQNQYDSLVLEKYTQVMQSPNWQAQQSTMAVLIDFLDVHTKQMS